MIHRNKIFTNFATSNKDYPVHSSSGLGRRPLTAETRVRTPDALQKARSLLAGFSVSPRFRLTMPPRFISTNYIFK